MYQRESFYRGKTLGSESKCLPGPIYNEMRLLYQRSGKSCLFVPIRSMQYMAVIDDEEIIFVDSQRKRVIEFSWQKFSPQSRNSLEDPVPYEFVYYDTQALKTMLRAQGEFSLCIHQMTERKQAQQKPKKSDHTVLKFPGQ